MMNYKYLLTLIISVNCYQALVSQACIVGDVVLSSQAEVEQFAQDHPNCTEIEGNVLIGTESFSGETDITNLAALSNLTSITGDIKIIKNTSLTNIFGLHNLEAIPASLLIENNDLLRDVVGLENITEIGGDLGIRINCDCFESKGLENVKVVRGDFNLQFEGDHVLRNIAIDSIYGSLRLERFSGSLSGLSELDYLGGKLYSYRSFLSSYNGLQGLESLGSLSTIGNYGFSSLNGLQNVKVIHGDVLFDDTDDLSSLSKLENLELIEGDLDFDHIWYMDISTLPKLKRIKGSLNFTENHLTSSLQGIPTLEVIEGNLNFSRNYDLDHIDGFTSLDSVKGDLIMYDFYNSLKDFTGLNSIKNIGGDLSIRSHVNLETLGGFAELQSICGNIWLEDNEKLENVDFAPKLTKLGGIKLIGLDEVFNLPDYSSIQFGSADIIIQNLGFDMNFDFLKDLTEIGGNLEITGNYRLDSFPALEFLEHIGGDLIITSNTNLDSPITFDRLQTIGGGIHLSYLDGLESLDFLASIDTIHGALELVSLNNLSSLDGLRNISSIEGELRLRFLNNISSIQNLENIRHIGDGLSIQFMSQLENLEGVNDLELVKNGIDLSYNSSLKDISALSNINADSLITEYGQALRIYKNDSLSNCSIHLVCDLLNISNDKLRIEENAIGCNGLYDIDCLDYGISGIVYHDVNCNNVKDDQEYGIANYAVHILPDDVLVYTNEAGKYLYKSEVNQVYNIINLSHEDWSTVGSDTLTTLAFQEGESSNTGYDFALKSSSISSSAEAQLSSNPTRCNTWVDFKIKCRNTGANIENGRLYLDKIEDLSMGSFSINPKNDGSRYYWTLEDFYPQQQLNIDFRVKMPSEQFTGDSLSFKYYVSYDITTEDHVFEDRLESVVLCSYDPNDKAVDPPGVKEEHYTLKEDTLNYRIRFQNTGNAPAIDVRIIDTLDQNLDWSTFKIINSSHSMNTVFRRDHLEFVFKNIYLPDSISNEPESHGYINYSIESKEGVPDYTRVENQAHIIFDYNPPIITNRTFNTLVDEICTFKYTMIDTTICEGDTLEGYFDSGVFSDTINIGITCDSIRTYNLSVTEPYTLYRYPRICLGDTFNFRDVDYLATSDTLFFDTIFTELGCAESIYRIDLSVSEAQEHYQEIEICQGEEYRGFTSTGVYYLDSMNWLTQCTDQIIIDLSVLDQLHPRCYDGDLDGYVAYHDCDDDNPDVYPGAEELCNDIDDDCNGEIDEGLALVTYFQDLDGDGHGTSEETTTWCGGELDGYSLSKWDCDDTDPDINPDAIEIAGNLIDEDCNNRDHTSEEPFPFYDLGDIRIYDSLGEYQVDYYQATVEGVVHSPNFLDPDHLMFFIIDQEGHGIAVFQHLNQIDFDQKLGDRLRVRGYFQQYKGLLEIIPESIEVIEEYADLVNPQTVESLKEQYESSLLRLDNVSLVDQTEWLGDGSSFNVRVQSQSGIEQLRIQASTYWSTQPAPIGVFNVIGICSQFDESSPYLDSYQLLPRYENDIFLPTSVVDEKQILLQVVPNPFQDQITVGLENGHFDNIKLIGAKGQVYFDQEYTYHQKASLDTSDLPSGFYIIIVESQESKYYQKLIKN